MTGRPFNTGNKRAGKKGSAHLIPQIREDYANGMTQGALVRKYGYSISQIGRIVRGEVWADRAEVEQVAEQQDRPLTAEESLAVFQKMLREGKGNKAENSRSSTEDEPGEER